MVDIIELSAAEMAAEIKSKRISPVEAVQAAMDQVEARSDLNAFVTVTGEEALRSARDAEAAIMRGDEVGALHGIPYSAKDMINTAGVRTTNGSLVFKDNVPKEDAVSIARMKKAGAILIGKTTTPEFGHKPSAYSPVSGWTLHPTHPKFTPGGSSSGAAVAVAAQMGPIALGTDGGGSVRIPAACCGIVGLKATLGAIPHLQLPDMFGANSYVGPMARNVKDTALLFEVIRGFSDLDPYGQAALPAQKNFAGFSDLKVAWLPTGGALVDKEVAAATEAAVDAMAAEGAVVEEIAIDFKSLEPAFMTVLRAGLAARVGPNLEKHRDVIDGTLVDRIEEGRRLSSVDLSEASFARTAMFRTLQKILDDFDIIVSPTITAPPLPVDLDTHRPIELNGGPAATVRGVWYPFTYPLNLTGHPGISIPCGKVSNGLPVGLQLITRWHQDSFLLQVAEACEQILSA